MRICSAKQIRKEAEVAGQDGTVKLQNPHQTSTNWRGLAVPPKKRKLTSYFSPGPEWLHSDPAVKKEKSKARAVKNGNNQQPVKLGKGQHCFMNTCAFDAFCQSLCYAFCDSLSAQNMLNSSEESKVLQLVKSLA